MRSPDAGHAEQHDVLIASSTSLIREVFHDIFLYGGYQCLLAADGREAIEIFRGWRPSLVVTDFNLRDMSALELLEDLRREDPDAAVVVLCGNVLRRNGNTIGFLEIEEVRTAGLKLGAYAFLEKPVRLEDVLLTAAQAIKSRRTGGQRQPLDRHWSEVRPMADVSELLAMFAAVFARERRPEDTLGA